MIRAVIWQENVNVFRNRITDTCFQLSKFDSGQATDGILANDSFRLANPSQQVFDVWFFTTIGD